MAFMNALLSAEMTNLVGKFLLVLYNAIGDFGWTVVVFTVLLKTVVLPLDIWQKISMRKQSKAMERIRPQLEKLQKQYANHPDILRQKQAELQKKEKIHVFASCLPMIITIVIFFVVWAGFRALVAYENEVIIEKLMVIYNDNIGKVQAGEMSMTELNTLLANSYDLHSWLWVKNVFMSDIGTNVIPDLDTFLGTIGATMPELSTGLTYDKLIGPAMDLYNKQSFWDAARWNGYFGLPILSIATSFFSTKLMQSQNPQMPTGTAEQQKTQQATTKILNYLMPLMLGVFAIMYSAAFAIYYFLSNVYSTVVSLIFNLIMKSKDKQEKDRILSTTYVGGRK